MSDASAPVIFIVSDGRGGTCAQLVKAALIQFEGHPYRTELRSGVRTDEDVREVVEEAAAGPAVIFYTLVSEETRGAMKAYAEEHLVPAADLLGPAFTALNDLFHANPAAVPGLLYDTDRDYFDRIEAIDYTLKHDDGQRPHELFEADLVLVGVSRASKSTTCFYLAYQCVKAANLPLFPDIPPPRELLALDPRKVVGLTVNVARLRAVREARVSSMAMGALDSYTDPRSMAREIRTARQLMQHHGWPTVDVSYKAVEEIGKEVLKLHRSRTG